MLQRNYNKYVEKWGAEWLRVGSTLTLKPDLDNANVGISSFTVKVLNKAYLCDI